MQAPLSGPQRVVATFVGSGVPRGGHLVQVLRALERRNARYHKRIPGVVERVRDLELLDGGSWVGEGGIRTLHVRREWELWRREPPLSQEGLDGLVPALEDLPPGLHGLRFALGYAFPGREAELLELTVLWLDGGRWEVRLAADAARVLSRGELAGSRAAALVLADLAEAVHDVMTPAHGSLGIDVGSLPDRLPAQGWGYYSPALVEAAGRAAVEAFSRRCYKSWELGDRGWFLAPTPLDAPDPELDTARAALFATCRHLPLERMAQALVSAAAGVPS